MSEIHGTYARVSMDEVIQQAKSELDIENTTQWDLFLQVEGEEAVRNLNCQSLVYKKQKCIDICEGQTPLPCGFYKFLGLRYYDQKLGSCQKVIYADTMFLNAEGCNNLPFPAGETSWFTKNWFTAMQIVNGKMSFVNGKNFDKATIAYLGFNVDENGHLIIYEHYVRAVKAYMKYRFMMKKPQNYVRMQIDDAMAEWKAQKRFVKGEDNAFNADLYRREIMAAMTALIVSPTIPTWTY
jgi:hypothetical protein